MDPFLSLIFWQRPPVLATIVSQENDAFPLIAPAAEAAHAGRSRSRGPKASTTAS
jgi:hypothetical protein